MHTAEAGPDVSDVEALEQALHGPVLAVRAVQDGEDDVGLEQPTARRDGDRLALATPHPVTADLDGEHLVAARGEALAHRGARGERDLVLGGPPPGEDDDPHAEARLTAPPAACRPCPAFPASWESWASSGSWAG